jgi:hypothetical protein
MFGLIGGYIALLFVLSLLGAVVGFVAHHVHAAVGGDERPLWEDGWSGWLLSREHEYDKRMGQEYGPDGWWDGESNRNLVMYMASGAITPLLCGVLGWSDGLNAFAKGCIALGTWAPRLCP